MIVERLAVFLHHAPDLVAVDKELLELLRLSLLHLPLGIDLLGGLQGTEGVVFADLVQLLLVVPHLVHQLGNPGQRRLGGRLCRRGRSQQQWQEESGGPRDSYGTHNG